VKQNYQRIVNSEGIVNKSTVHIMVRWHQWDH